MSQLSLNFIKKLDTLLPEAQLFCSSSASDEILNELSNRRKIDKEKLTKLFYEVFVRDFDLKELEALFRSYNVLNEEDIPALVNDFVGMLLLPIDKYVVEMDAEKFLVDRKVDVSYYEKYKKQLLDEIEYKNLEIIDKNLDEVEKSFDREAETKFILDYLKNNLKTLLLDTTDAIANVNGSILYLLENDKKIKDEFLRAIEKNQERLSSKTLKVEKESLEPTVQNWLKDFIKYHGTDNFSNVVLSKYITRANNCKVLDEKEKKIVRKFLVFYRNLKFFPESMKDVPIERWEIFPVEVTAKDTVRSSSLSTPKTDSEKEIDQLKEEEGRYDETSLERAALEEEIGDKGRAEELKAEASKYKEGSLERQAIDEEIKRLEK